MYPAYSRYADFDAAYKFADKAGFQLSEIQATDVDRFVIWDRSLNTYEVGCGKTVVSTVVALMRGNDQKLVLMPPILLTSWTKWLKTVTDGVVKYSGTPAERKKLDVKNAHWLVMSYGIFRQDFDRLERDLSENLEIIVDEAHAMKNASSVLFKKVSRLL